MSSRTFVWPLTILIAALSTCNGIPEPRCACS